MTKLELCLEMYFSKTAQENGNPLIDARQQDTEPRESLSLRIRDKALKPEAGSLGTHASLPWAADEAWGLPSRKIESESGVPSPVAPQ